MLYLKKINYEKSNDSYCRHAKHDGHAAKSRCAISESYTRSYESIGTEAQEQTISSFDKTIFSYKYAGNPFDFVINSSTAMTVTKVVGIGPNVFGGRVTGIDFSNTIKRIGYQAFNGSIMPSTMNIPESITTIDAHAFYECRKLKSVYIPAIVTSIGYAPFYNCYDLEEIVVASDNPNYKSVDGVLYNKDMTEVIQYPGGKTKRTYVAPSSVVSINREAFACNRNVYSVVLPYGVRYLSVAAFNNATLHDIFLPASMVDIGDAAFTPFRTGFTNQPKIYVMSGTRRQYLSAVPWSGEENIIEAEFVQK